MARAEAIERAAKDFTAAIQDGDIPLMDVFKIITSTYDAALIAGLQRAERLLLRQYRAKREAETYSYAYRAIRAEITRLRKGAK